jgi:hypothetical protein
MAPSDWLRAGEATSAALLIATQNGLATTVLSKAAKVADTRRQLADTVVRVLEHAQLVLRVGWAPDSAAALPDTPRRALRYVLLVWKQRRALRCRAVLSRVGATAGRRSGVVSRSLGAHRAGVRPGLVLDEFPTGTP